MRRNPITALPAGRYRCRLESRRTSSQLNVDGRQAHPVDLVLVIVGGPYASQRLTCRCWSSARIQRARSLRRDAPLIAVVIEKRLETGALVNRVIDFWPADEPTVVEALGGDTVPVAHAKSTPSTEIDLPQGLLQQICSPNSCGSQSEECRSESTSSVPAAPHWATEFCIGFYCRGAKHSRRILGDHDSIIQQYATCCSSLSLEAAGFVSLYQYAEGIRTYVKDHEGSLAGYRSKSWTRWLAMDLDGDSTDAGLERILEDTRRIVAALIALGVPASRIVVFFSGGRGMHIMWPSGAHAAGPKEAFEDAVRLTVRVIADRVGVAIDEHLYMPLAMLRAPNTRHEKTGLYKVAIPLSELATLSVNGMRAVAKQPRPFQMPSWITAPVPLLHDLWIWACQVDGGIRQRATAVAAGELRIFADTFDLMVHGAPEGSRGMRFFKAAMNLLDFNCPEPLLHALLEPAARLSDYSMNEFAAQIDGAIKAHVGSGTSSN